jgi:hypothetical protein
MMEAMWHLFGVVVNEELVHGIGLFERLESIEEKTVEKNTL